MYVCMIEDSINDRWAASDTAPRVELANSGWGAQNWKQRVITGHCIIGTHARPIGLIHLVNDCCRCCRGDYASLAHFGERNFEALDISNTTVFFEASLSCVVQKYANLLIYWASGKTSKQNTKSISSAFFSQQISGKNSENKYNCHEKLPKKFVARSWF